jgi:isoleucyl-tRNA synthetase
MESEAIKDYEQLYFPGGEWLPVRSFRHQLTQQHAALQRVNTFISGPLSSLYFEETKDILYCDAAHSGRRQAVAAVLGHVSRRHKLLHVTEGLMWYHQILYRLTRILSPITPHLCEEVSNQITEKAEGRSTIWADDVSLARSDNGPFALTTRIFRLGNGTRKIR